MSCQPRGGRTTVSGGPDSSSRGGAASLAESSGSDLSGTSTCVLIAPPPSSLLLPSALEGEGRRAQRHQRTITFTKTYEAATKATLTAARRLSSGTSQRSTGWAIPATA